jgi:hypothetical protein
MESLFQSPFGLLLCFLGLLLVSRKLGLNKAAFAAVQQEGSLVFVVIYILLGGLITILVSAH